MRKKKNFFVWIISGLTIIVVLGLFISYAPGIRNAFYSITAPIQQRMLHSGNTFFKRLEIFQNAREVEEEIESLRRENRKLLAELSVLKEVEKENKALRKAMELENLEEEERVLVEVFGRDLSGYSLLIKHGNSEVNENDPVITPEGVLIGSIREVYKDYSKVKLIIDPDNSFEVRIQNEDEPIGLLKGTGEETLLLDLLPKDKEIKRGDSVISLSQKEMPKGGLFIGEVYEVEDDDIEAFKRARVWQGVDPRYLDYLFVIKN